MAAILPFFTADSASSDQEFSNLLQIEADRARLKVAEPGSGVYRGT